MTSGRSPADTLILRLQYVAMRLEDHAAAAPAPGLTAPDQPSGEQWEWGQVWAHLGEFIPYWIDQVRRVLAGDGRNPVPFGRVRTDPGRVAAIERDRGVPPAQLWARMRSQMADLWNFIEHMPAEDWGKRGVHPTLGVMDVPKMIDEFLVGHLEQHAEQLDGLAAASQI
jgi:DinB superfamily